MRSPSPGASASVLPWLAGLLVLAGGLAVLDAVEGRESPPSVAPAVVAREVDAVIDARLAAEGVAPAGRTGDEEFLRRVTLDLTGTLPTPAALAAFVADRRADKRARAVDALLADEAYAAHYADWWYKTLTGLTPGVNVREGGGGRALAGLPGERFLAWLAEQLASGRSAAEWVSDLITATGRTDENPAAVYYARWDGNPNNAASAVARHFLGVRIQCAQCHDHVYEETWKQTDFQGMAAFFALTRQERAPEYRELQRLQREREQRAKEMGEEAPAPRPGRPPAYEGKSPEEVRRLLDARNVVIVSDLPPPERTGPRAARLLERAGERNPELKERLALRAVTPRFWMGPTAADVPGIPRRLLLARWVTADENPLFARALVNRLWGALLGRGFVHPVDDFNSFNPPSHPEALDRLAQDFRAHGYDLKRLLRVITATQAYQRASRREGPRPDPALFAVARVRPLSIEQLYGALTRATGADEVLDRRGREESRRARAAVFTAFSFVFDDDEEAEEQDFEGSIPQGLFLMNGELIHRVIAADGRRAPLARLLAALGTDAERVEHLYRRAYARAPSPPERAQALAFLRKAGGGPDAWEDLFWALLNSAEFMTNH